MRLPVQLIGASDLPANEFRRFAAPARHRKLTIMVRGNFIPALPAKNSHHCDLCGKMVLQEDVNFYCDYDQCKPMKTITAARAPYNFIVFSTSLVIFVLIGWVATVSIGSIKLFHDRHLNVQSFNDISITKYDSPFRSDPDITISRKF